MRLTRELSLRNSHHEATTSSEFVGLESELEKPDIRQGREGDASFTVPIEAVGS